MISAVRQLALIFICSVILSGCLVPSEELENDRRPYEVSVIDMPYTAMQWLSLTLRLKKISEIVSDKPLLTSTVTAALRLDRNGNISDDGSSSVLYIDKSKLDILDRFLPWPPPVASSSVTLDREVIQNGDIRKFGDVSSLIETSIRRNGYYSLSYFYAPNGFAIATQIEQIDTDGKPKSSPNRWAISINKRTISTFDDYIKSLILGKEGRFRLFIFILTDDPAKQDNGLVTFDQAKSWSMNGLNFLPNDYAQNKIVSNHRLYALIYEFYSNGDSDPVLIRPSSTPPEDQVARAGIKINGTDASVSTK